MAAVSRFRRRLLLAVALLGAACSRIPSQVPPLTLDGFLPSVRAQVQKSYDDVRLHPQDPDANGRLAMILHAYGQFDSAAVFYGRARALAPREFRWAYYLGTAQAAGAKNSEALATLQQALALQPQSQPARLKLAEVLLALGRARESQLLYEAAAQQDPQFAAPHYGLGRALTAQGDTAAVEHYRRACELWPAYGAAHYALALAYQKSGQSDLAREHMALYEKNQLSEPPSRDDLLDAVQALNDTALSHLKKGVSLEAAGRLPEAAAEHEQALALDPQLVQAHVNLIPLYGRLGQVDKAEQHYRAAVALEPNRAASHYDFGVLLFEAKKYHEAAEAFRRTLAADPRHPDAHNNLGFLLEREGRRDEALRHFRAALESRPNFRLAHFHLGRLLLQQGHTAEAIRHLEQTLQPQDESTPGYLYALGAAHARAGNRAQALQYCRQARDRAAALGQTQLLASIERDLRTLEPGASP
jgi:tetratricopeptide (TPR) repeat protein